MTAAEAQELESCIAAGGVALFPADTVYGLAADPDSAAAVDRLYELKRRRPDQPSAVMFFGLAPALAALPKLGFRTRAAFEQLLPGPLTLIVPNPERRYPIACGPAPERLGVRVPDLSGPLTPLAGVTLPVLQSSANHHGGPDPRKLEDVPAEIRAAVDLALDGGELPGVASTVVDMTTYEDDGEWAVLREGALSTQALTALVP